MTTSKPKSVWNPSRQVVRAKTRRLLWRDLKGTDFAGEPVAVRDAAGDIVIRRRSRAAIKDMLHAACRRRYAVLRTEAAAAVAKRDGK